MNDNVKEYFNVFLELPPIIYMLSYDEEHYNKLIERAVKRNVKISLKEVTRMIKVNNIQLDLID